jgi:hypothetical protein
MAKVQCRRERKSEGKRTSGSTRYCKGETELSKHLVHVVSSLRFRYLQISHCAGENYIAVVPQYMWYIYQVPDPSSTYMLQRCGAARKCNSITTLQSGALSLEQEIVVSRGSLVP